MVFDLSKKSKYAFLALLELAHRGPEQPVNARLLATHYDMPLRFLEIILNELKQGGFVRSIRGKAGGYVLAHPAKAITLWQILDFLERSTNLPTDAAAEPPAGSLVVQSLIEQANTDIQRRFEACTLQSLAQQELERRTDMAPNYVI